MGDLLDGDGGGGEIRGLGAWDWAMVAGYFVLCLGVGFGATCTRAKERSGEEEGDRVEGVEGGAKGSGGGVEEFFLAGRSTAWWAVGGSLFASNIGSEHFIGLAGSGADIGMCVAWGEWLSPLCLLLLAWFFAPFYHHAGVFTMPEFLEKRYAPGLRTYYATLLLALYVLTKISVALYAGAVVLQQTVVPSLLRLRVLVLVTRGFPSCSPFSCRSLV